MNATVMPRSINEPPCTCFIRSDLPFGPQVGTAAAPIYDPFCHESALHRELAVRDRGIPEKEKA